MMSLFKNKWLAMMLLCGSMDLTYVDAMRRHPERKVDAAASCKVDGCGLEGTDYAVGKPTVLVGDTRETAKRVQIAAVPLIHTYHHQFMSVFAAKFPNGVFFDSVCSELTNAGIPAGNPECAFLAVLDRERSYAGAPLLFRPQYMFIGEYSDSNFAVHSNIQAFMIENDARVRLQAVNDTATLHPHPDMPQQGNPMRVSPERLDLVLANGATVLHDPHKTRTVIYHMILNNHPVIGMVILLGSSDADIWDRVIRDHSNWGGVMNCLFSFGWLSSSPSLFEPGAPLAAFLPQPTMVEVLPEPKQPVVPQPTMVEVLPEPEQPVVPSSDAKVPPKKNLHLRLCLPPEPEQPVVPQPTMVEVLPEQEQPVVPSSDVGVRLCQHRVLENDTSYTLSDCDTVRLPIRIRQMVTGSEGMQDVNLILSASISDPGFVGDVCSSFAWDLQTDTDKQVDFFIATRDWNLSSICLVNEEDRLSHMWILKKGLRDEVSCEGSIGKLDIRSDGEFNSDSSCVVCYKQLMGQDGSINCGVVLLLDPSDADVYMQVLRTAEAPTIGAILADCWSRNALHDVAELRVLSAFFKW